MLPGWMVAVTRKHLPKWADIVPGELFGRLLDGVSVTVGNDASLGGLGEYVFGEGRASQNLIYVKAATGIGADFVINGAMYQGAAGTAGEIGHMTRYHLGEQCRCGNRGCLELYAGGAVILAEARKAGYFRRTSPRWWTPPTPGISWRATW